MGDTGAMLIGLLLAASATSASGKITMNLYGTADLVALMSPIIVVVAAVFVPVLDLIMAVVRRVSKGQSPFAADRLHIHHRMLALGHSQRQAVLLLYLWVSAVAFGAVSFSVVPSALAAILSVAALATAAVATAIPVSRRRAGTLSTRD